MYFARLKILSIGLLILVALPFCNSATAERGTVPENVRVRNEKEESLRAELESTTVLANQVRLVVGEISITDVDIQQLVEQLQRSRETGNLRDKAIDILIERAIVEIEARRETIIVSDERVQNELNFRRQAMGVTDQERFQELVEEETGLSFDDWVEDVRYQIVKRQLTQIVLTVEQPTEDEVRDFYNANRARMGNEVSYREIVLVPRSNDIREEARVSDAAKEIWGRVTRDPSAFAEVARTSPANRSPQKPYGGLVGYTGIHEIADRNRILAGVLHNLSPGQVSRIFRDNYNRYYIVKLEGKRPIPYDKMREIIRRRLYFENEEKAFDIWLERRRKEISIRYIE
ncbi:MAG: peptidyl-prolyl cis-trans isomerase [Leptospiraceae bacterium]|nr:peptidyl-prolyl cis-trans isomerase [Leptospiraceae bacterium]